MSDGTIEAKFWTPRVFIGAVVAYLYVFSYVLIMSLRRYFWFIFNIVMLNVVLLNFFDFILYHFAYTKHCFLIAFT